MAKKKASTPTGRVSVADLMKMVNKKAGQDVAHDLTGGSPTEVKQWIPTSSHWLDCIIAKGKVAGIPVGKISEIAGLEATGKSYMAAQIAANAHKMGMLVVYFDSESAIDPDFLERAGCDLSRLMYIQATNVEFVLETIEELLGAMAMIGQEVTTADLVKSGKFIYDTCCVESSKEIDSNGNLLMTVCLKLAEEFALPEAADIKKK